MEECRKARPDPGAAFLKSVSGWLRCWVMIYLVREHLNFVQDRADRSAPLSTSGEGNDAVTAHIVTTSHNGATREGETSVIMNAAG